MDKPVGTVAVANNVEEQINQYLEECPGGYRCTFCGKTCIGRPSTSKRDTQRHIETHIEGLSYECQICHKILRTKNALKTHKSTFHRNTYLRFNYFRTKVAMYHHMSRNHK